MLSQGYKIRLNCVFITEGKEGKYFGSYYIKATGLPNKIGKISLQILDCAILDGFHHG